MLKGIDPILTPEILYALSAMGHGDDVVVVDANFPSDTAARTTVIGKVLRLPGVDTRGAIRAVLSVLMLDNFCPSPIERMAVTNGIDIIPPVQQEALAEVHAAEGRNIKFASLSREEFYARSGKSFCVIATGETRPWGCFIMKKGILVTPDDADGGTSLPGGK